LIVEIMMKVGERSQWRVVIRTVDDVDDGLWLTMDIKDDDNMTLSWRQSGPSNSWGEEWNKIIIKKLA